MLSLPIEVIQLSGVLVIRIQDILSLPATAIAELRDHLGKLAKDADSIVVNMQKVKLCSSQTVNLLLFIHKSFASPAKRIRLCHLQSDALEVLKLTRIDKVFDCFETETAALAKPSEASGTNSSS